MSDVPQPPEGNDSAPAAPTPSPAPQKKSKTWLWLLLGGIAIALLGVVGVCCVLPSLGLMGGVGALVAATAEVRQGVIDHVEADSALVEKLGEPLEYPVSGGNSNINNSQATVTMRVEGTNTSGTINADLTHDGNKWVVQSGTITYDDGSSSPLK